MDEVELAMAEWEAGYREVEELRSDPRRYRAAARAVEAIGQELRRRLGSTFTLDELVALYGDGTDWALELAMRMGARLPEALDARAADAAFYLYMREAADWAGGRHVRA